MRPEPKNGWIIGRVAITKVSESIVLANQGKNVTRYTFIDYTSPEAEAAGYHVGDFVVFSKNYDVLLNSTEGRVTHCVTANITDAVFKAHDLAVDRLVHLDGEPFKTKTEDLAA